MRVYYESLFHEKEKNKHYNLHQHLSKNYKIIKIIKILSYIGLLEKYNL